MLVQLAKVLAQFSLLVDAKILLISEEDDASCSYESCQVVLLYVGEIGKIDAVDFGADFRIVVEDVRGAGEKILKTCIT